MKSGDIIHPEPARILELMGATHRAFGGPAERSVPDQRFKAETADATVITRTGETNPYANAVLRRGVPFG